MLMAVRKPPPPLLSEKIHKELRYKDVCLAIHNYLQGGWTIPLEWIKEYNAFLEWGAFNHQLKTAEFLIKQENETKKKREGN